MQKDNFIFDIMKSSYLSCLHQQYLTPPLPQTPIPIMHLCTGQGHLTTDWIHVNPITHTFSEYKGLCSHSNFAKHCFCSLCSHYPCNLDYQFDLASFTYLFLDYCFSLLGILKLCFDLGLLLGVWYCLLKFCTFDLLYGLAIVYCLLYLCYIVNKHRIMQMHSASAMLPDIMEIRMQSAWNRG